MITAEVPSKSLENFRAVGWGFQGVLPYSEHIPFKQAKLLISAKIAPTVRDDLGLPVFPVVLGQSVASRTAVPKAAIDENRRSARWEDKVWLAGQVRVPSPAGDLRRAEQARECFLRGGVSFGANARHVVRALRSGEPIGHRLQLSCLWGPDFLKGFSRCAQRNNRLFLRGFSAVLG